MRSFFTDPIRQSQLVQTAVVLIGTVVLWWLFVRGVSRKVDGLGQGGDIEATERRQRAQTLWRAGRRAAAVVVVVIVLLTAMNIWAIPITAFVAVGSAIGVAVGFGAQSMVKDVIAGFFILAEDQFGIGDVVRIAGVTGSVVDMRLRITVLRDLDGNAHYVPNGEITVASNFTQSYAQVVIDVGVAYHENVDHALDVFGDELRRFAADADWSAFVLEDPVVLGVEELGDSSVTIRGYLKVAPDRRWLVRRELFRRIKNRFDADSIEIPFPQRTVHIANPEALG
ncbi:MAG TPA: mechanosensitive ion channel family protein [Acidimicrobiia bacterium]|nr:mechanosensitive ion channel family protein [Acidimicrobiia bacterium]